MTPTLVFDIETIPDVAGLRALHGLPAALSDAEVAEPAWTAAPIPGYEVPGIAHPRLATGAAGLAGTLAVLGIALAAGRLLARKPQR
jgi:hypothetical protein